MCKISRPKIKGFIVRITQEHRNKANSNEKNLSLNKSSPELLDVGALNNLLSKDEPDYLSVWGRNIEKVTC